MAGNQMMMRGGGGRPGPRRPAMMSPADFNRLARLQRQRVGSIAFASGVAGNGLNLPRVGYLYRVGLYFDFDLGTTAACGVTARFLSGHFGGNTARFPCPLGILPGIKVALNVSSPVWATDGYGAHVLGLVNSRGMNPWIQAATSDVGFNRKERFLFAILNNTTGAIVAPDSALAASTNYKVRGSLILPITLGDAAAAGLIPVQDARITPQVFLDFGTKTDLVSVGGDVSTPTGNVDVTADYFVTMDDSIRPDTEFIKQTTMEMQQVAGTGDQNYRPQLGGTMLRVTQSVWNNTKAIDPSTITSMALIVQQAVRLEERDIETFIGDERKYYSKRLPDEVFVWDHTTGLGDPTMPSLRDRISSAQLTDLAYRLTWSSGTAVTATAEIRNYKEQLVPVGAVSQ